MIGKAWILLLPALLAASPAALPKDKSKPVRHALEQRYAELARAVETRNLALFQSLRTATFHTRDLDGRESDAAAMRERSRRMLEGLRPPIHSSFDLGTIDVQGDRAVATVTQHFSRMQMVAGRLRKVDTSVTQDETWIRTAEGWKLETVDNERDLLWFVDGKRVKPGAPYDPDASPYQPPSS